VEAIPQLFQEQQRVALLGEKLTDDVILEEGKSVEDV